MREEVWGGLKVRITGGTDREGGGHGPVVVLSHGYGAPGTDLVSLWRVIDVPPHVRFVFPEAPLSLDFIPRGRAWWLLDMERLQRAVASREPNILLNDVPDGLVRAREQFARMLDDLEPALSVPRGQLILGGFSQGAMLSCDAVLHSQRHVGGLIVLSGALVAQDDWVPRMRARTGLQVFQSHGVSDPLLPFFVAEQLRDRMTEAGLHVHWVPFQGAHEIPNAVVTALSKFLHKIF